MSGIVITFADGETLAFPSHEGSSVLVSAEKAGSALAHNCRQGICRTCAARGEDGEEVLLCITPARDGFRATVPYRRADVSPVSERRAKINGFARVSASVWEVRYRLQFPLPFLPGQFIEVSFPGLDGPRRFSMANAPPVKEQILHIRDIPGGGMSTYLNQRAKADDPFTVRGPFGVFYLRATAKPKLFVAGGTGLAPIMSMLRSIDRASPPPLAVVAGFATPGDAYGIEELGVIATELPLEIVLTADKADASWTGLIANAVASLQAVRMVALAPGTEAYLCGPPGMVAAARQALLKRGVTERDIFAEEFVADVGRVNISPIT